MALEALTDSAQPNEFLITARVRGSADGAPFFKEFTLELPNSPERVVKRLQKERILAGVPLKTFDRAYKNCLLVAVTEQRTRGEIDAYAAALAAATA